MTTTWLLQMALKFQILFGNLFQISNERANFKPYVIVTVTNTGKNTRTPYKRSAINDGSAINTGTTGTPLAKINRSDKNNGAVEKDGLIVTALACIVLNH
jgi:hypothetical protein